MLKLIHKIYRRISGDWWEVTTSTLTTREDGVSRTRLVYGVSHPWRWHSWAPNLTREEAEAQCKKLNS